MLNNRRKQATSNLALLELTARRLGNLNENVVYLGGCATALFINDPFSLMSEQQWMLIVSSMLFH